MKNQSKLDVPREHWDRLDGPQPLPEWFGRFRLRVGVGNDAKCTSQDKRGLNMRLTLAVVTLLASLFCNGFVGTYAIAQTTVRIATPGPSPSYLPIEVARKNGFFRKRGINVEYIQMVPAISVPALLNGEIDYSTVPAPAAVAAARGLPVRVISFTSVKLQHTLVSRPEIRSPLDLAGKKIGIARAGDLTAFEAQFIIGKYRLGQDTTLVSIPDSSQRLEAVKLGLVDAAIQNPVHAVRAEEMMGLRRILEVGDILEIPQVGLVTSLEKINNNRGSVLQVVEAMIEGLIYTRSQSHREEVINIIAKWVSLDEVKATKVYESVKNTFSRYGVPSQKQESAYLSMLKATAGLPENASPGVIFEFSLAEEAAKKLGVK